jgi:hypothetical protein
MKTKTVTLEKSSLNTVIVMGTILNFVLLFYTKRDMSGRV